MESLFFEVNWIAVGVGAVLAFLLGWLWYSPKLFGTKWAVGVGININDNSGPKAKAVFSQAIGTFLLSWVIGITATMDAIGLAVLIAVTIAVLIKANGLFAKKSRYAVVTESSFIIAMVFVMVLIHIII